MAIVKGKIRVTNVEIDKYEAYQALVTELGFHNQILERKRDGSWKLENVNGKKCLAKYYGDERSHCGNIYDPKKIRAYEVLLEIEKLMGC